MANYDTKLGEWYKQLEKRAEELLARKRATETPQEAESPAEQRPQVVSAEIEAPAERADASALSAVDGRKVVADVAVIEKPEAEAALPAVPVERRDRRPALFDDAEIPPVEDFLSFLSRSGERQPDREQPTFEISQDRGVVGLSEGTGIPRPVAVVREEPVAPPAAVAQPRVTPEPAQAQPAAETELPLAEVTPSQPPAQGTPAAAAWERVPQHLRILFDSQVDEVAQHSYKSFRESRAGLIERLLDPSVSLEDAARLLNVCPTTVRRYTNKGILKHYRTAGNQRRFKLSDVLAFMETRQ